MDYFAHSGNDFQKWHLLKTHLASVSSIADKFLKGFQGCEEAALAGLLHDLGKYGDAFQARLRGEEEGLDHWSQGAWIALTKYKSVAAALAIQGHHIGLQWGDKDALRMLEPNKLCQRHPLNLRLSEANLDVLNTRFAGDNLVASSPNTCLSYPFNTVSTMLDVRMIFSALVDADFIDTEAHFNGDAQSKKYRNPGSELRPESALKILHEHMVGLRQRSIATCEQDVLNARDLLWNVTTNVASEPTGLWTLTAPTGSGKTLAMLNFALEHARVHQLERIIIVIPFLTILEQTARVYRMIFEPHFGKNYVLEHHSLAGLGKEKDEQDADQENQRMRRLLSENWDAPIIVTTNVQLLESLFSNRPSSCRKLHRLIRSVIMFDEAQNLPIGLAVPSLSALSHLASRYNSSIVFATATQPAFDHLDEAVTRCQKGQNSLDVSGWKPKPILKNEKELFGQLCRTHIHWPQKGNPISFDHLAHQIVAQNQVLCVVNLKRHAIKLMSTLQTSNADGIFHLSTNLCPAHRQDVLQAVSERLKSDQPCRLISTQCIEAGVDVDFPVVYRAFAPLEAIAQAAGRCNRNGMLKGSDRKFRLGDVHVFIPEKDTVKEENMYPTFAYYQAASLTQLLLADKGAMGLDLNDPQTFRDYYKRLYDLGKPEAQAKEILNVVEGQHFVKVAELYRLISEDTIMVLVPYAKRIDDYRKLRGELDTRGLHASWMRRAQELSVSLYRPKWGHPLMGVLIPAKLQQGGVSDEWFVLDDYEEFAKIYDSTLGFSPPDAQPVLIA